MFLRPVGHRLQISICSTFCYVPLLECVICSYAAVEPARSRITSLRSRLSVHQPWRGRVDESLGIPSLFSPKYKSNIIHWPGQPRAS
ncbi:hypothetical protein BDV06DRAFT_34289 [Aspergillus oleicola]